MNGVTEKRWQKTVSPPAPVNVRVRRHFSRPCFQKPVQGTLWLASVRELRALAGKIREPRPLLHEVARGPQAAIIGPCEQQITCVSLFVHVTLGRTAIQCGALKARTPR